MNDLSKFAKNYLKYRTPTETGAISLVERLPAGSKTEDETYNVLHFRKIIKGYASALVKHEERILDYLTTNDISHTVRLLAYKNSPNANDLNNSSQIIITQAAGVALDNWYNVPIFIHELSRSLNDIYEHPLFVIKILQNSLVALEMIHQHNIIHCDIKMDNICLPYQGDGAESGNLVQIQLDNITLIDFGASYWIDNFGATDRIWLGYNENEEERYQSRLLINTLKQWFRDNHGKKSAPYNHESLKKINYSCDLYSLGVAFEHFCNNKYSNEIQCWNLVLNDLRSIIQELKNYDEGIPVKQIQLPHQQLIKKLNNLIQTIIKYEKSRGYFINNDKYFNVGIISSLDLGKNKNKKGTLITPTPIMNLEEDGEVSSKEPNDKNDEVLPKKSGKRVWLIGGIIGFILVSFMIMANFKDSDLPPSPVPTPSAISTIYVEMANQVYDVYENERDLKTRNSIFDKMIKEGNTLASLGYVDSKINLTRDGDFIDTQKYNEELKNLNFNINIIKELENIADQSYGASWLVADYYYWQNNQEKTLTYLLKTAKMNKPFAMKYLGFYYLDGESVPKQPSEALYWLRKAAELGDSDAMTQLGLLYETGEGTPIDYNEALKWYAQDAVIEKNYARILNIFEKLVDEEDGITTKQFSYLKAFAWRADENNSEYTIDYFKLLNSLQAEDFSIEESIENSNDLDVQKTISLIINTESMDHNEKQEWFDKYPSMTDSQRTRLKDILDNERIKLNKLEEKYIEELKTLNSRY